MADLCQKLKNERIDPMEEDWVKQNLIKDGRF